MRRILAAVCAALLLTGGLCAWAGASQQIPTFYQLSVNDALPPPSAAITPIEVGGIIYVPFTVIAQHVTEVDLGVYASQSRTSTQYTVTVYSLNGLLKFDLNANTCVDRDETPQNMRAIIRNSRVYIPASAVCNYFGLTYTLTPTQYGTLVRITNGQEYNKGDKFVSSAADLMRRRYNEYLQSLTSSSPSSGTSAAPSTSPAPTYSGDPADKRGVQVFLAFRCGTGTGLEGIASALEHSGTSGLFLFRPEEVAENAAWIRRLTGMGHTIGLITDAATGEEALAELAEGTRLLEAAARLRTHLVLAETEDEAVLTALNEAGWTCWRTNVDGVPLEGESQSTLAYGVIQTVALKRSRARVLMDDSAVAAGALPRILSELREEAYSLRVPVETAL